MDERVALFESALKGLLAEGVGEDVRPTLQKLITDPENIQRAYEKLAPQEQALLDSLLPAIDAASDDASCSALT